MEQAKEETSLWEIARLFLKLGCIGFGGPAVHIAMMEKEVVRERQWFTEEYFLDLIGATNLIPGPNSTEMTMHCGHERRGIKGLLVAGFCFIMPAVLITAAFAWAYRRYGHLPQAEPFIYGIKPAIIAVIASLMVTLGRRAIKTMELALIGLAALILVLCGFNEIYILFGLGVAAAGLHFLRTRRDAVQQGSPLLLIKASSLNWKVFWLFLKVGSILYGSGYVLFAFLDAELVKTGMISRSELIDAIAVGQFTPGPVFSSATFIGWQIGGLPGAVAATVGIFLPSFLFVALLNPLIPMLRRSKLMAAFLDAVNAVSVAMILAICIEMGKDSITDWHSILIACLGFAVASLFRNLNTAFIILGGALLGYLLRMV